MVLVELAAALPTWSAESLEDTMAEDKIRKRAYEIWERQGRPHGRAEEHWRQAQSEVGNEGAAADAGGEGLANKSVSAARRTPMPGGQPGGTSGSGGAGGLSSGLQSGGTIPGGRPGATQGSIGTGGGSNAAGASGSPKRSP